MFYLGPPPSSTCGTLWEDKGRLHGVAPYDSTRFQSLACGVRGLGPRVTGLRLPPKYDIGDAGDKLSMAINPTHCSCSMGFICIVLQQLCK